MRTGAGVGCRRRGRRWRKKRKLTGAGRSRSPNNQEGVDGGVGVVPAAGNQGEEGAGSVTGHGGSVFFDEWARHSPTHQVSPAVLQHQPRWKGEGLIFCWHSDGGRRGRCNYSAGGSSPRTVGVFAATKMYACLLRVLTLKRTKMEMETETETVRSFHREWASRSASSSSRTRKPPAHGRTRTSPGAGRGPSRGPSRRPRDRLPPRPG